MITNIKNKVIKYYNGVLLSIYKKLYIGTAYVPPNSYNTYIYDELLQAYPEYTYKEGDSLSTIAYNAGQQKVIHHIYKKYLQENKDTSLQDYMYDLKARKRAG
jgi:hypothetical protein